MSTRLLFTAAILAFTYCSFAQGDVPFDKQSIPDKNELKVAKTAVKAGDKLFEKGGFQFANAIEEYEKAYRINPDNAELNLKLGLCHLNGQRRYESLKYFTKAEELVPGIPRIHYLIGLGHQLNANWDEAIASFKMHQKTTGRIPDENPFYNESEKRITECVSGRTLQANTMPKKIRLIPGEVNTEAPEYGVVVSADGSEMYFTSRREGSTGGSIDPETNDYFEDIYFSSMENGEWSSPAQLEGPVNSLTNDATIGMFNDGSTLLMYRDRNGMGDILETVNKGGVWSAPKSIGDNINTDYHESSAWFSFDRKWLYFVSDRPDMTIGGTDIYRSRWNESEGTWDEPENLGYPVNSQYDEDGVFVHPDGKTIYFSSAGHNSMGGFDIFSSEYDNGKWSEPVNLGWPINSPDDDVFFVVTADGTKGYFSSVRPEGRGEDDLYEATLIDEAIDGATAMDGDAIGISNAGKKSVILLTGQVNNSSKNVPVEADIELFDLETGEPIANFSSKASSGEYSFAVPANREYGMNIKAAGYLFHSEKISVPEDGSFTSHVHDVDMKDLMIGSGIVLNNVFFEYNKSDLRNSSTGELKRVVELMNENPTLVLEMSGHTDNVGSDEYNLNLSERRASAVKDWLVGNGIDAKRLESVGYGESKPADTNSTDEGRARNRRTEMKILAK
jgi:outer membrane protein OmpA-like peptidoglycan-associated protein